MLGELQTSSLHLEHPHHWHSGQLLPVIRGLLLPLLAEVAEPLGSVHQPALAIAQQMLIDHQESEQLPILANHLTVQLLPQLECFLRQDLRGCHRAMIQFLHFSVLFGLDFALLAQMTHTLSIQFKQAQGTCFRSMVLPLCC